MYKLIVRITKHGGNNLMEEKNDFVTKTIKFYYFEVHKIDQNNNDQLFNLLQWANCLPKGNNNDDRVLGFLGDDRVRCDRTYSEPHNNKNFDWFHFTKLRDKNIPAKATLEDTDLTDIHLDENEYIAEDMTILFDETNYIAMIQNNIYSLSVGAITKYLNYFWNKGKDEAHYETIELRPIFEKDAFKSAKKGKNFKSIEFTMANSVNHNLLSGAIQSVFDSLKIAKGQKIKIKISAGRKSKSVLDSKEIISEINQIEQETINQGTSFEKATVKWQIDKKYKAIELINGRMCSSLSFDVPLKHSLHRDAVETKMKEEYYPDYENKMDYIQKHKR